jgi:hypothetical protein
VSTLYEAWSGKKRADNLLRLKSRELITMKLCVKVTYNKDGTDFSLFGPFSSTEAAERFEVYAKATRKGIVRTSWHVLHDPATFEQAAERLGVKASG